MSDYIHPDRQAAAEMTAAANERAGLRSRQRRHAAAFRKGAESATDDLHTLITAIAGTDNYDHTLPVSYFVEMLAAERRRSAMAAMYLRTGFIECPRCGEEVPTAHTDALIELDEARQPGPRT